MKFFRKVDTDMCYNLALAIVIPLLFAGLGIWTSVVLLGGFLNTHLAWVSYLLSFMTIGVFPIHYIFYGNTKIKRNYILFGIFYTLGCLFALYLSLKKFGWTG